MLELTGSDWQPRLVDYFHGETRGEDYRAFNVMGEAPVLFHGDTVLSQSGVILDYLAEVTGRFGAETPAERREIWRWILFDNHKLTSYTATLRFMRSIAKTGETPVTEFLDKRARGGVRRPQPATRRPRLRHRVAADHRRPLALRLPLLRRRARHRGRRLPGDRGVAGAHPRPPGWKHPYDLMPAAPLPEKF